MSHRHAWVFVFVGLSLAACNNPTIDLGLEASPSPSAAPGANASPGLNASATASAYVPIPGLATPPWPAPSDVSARVKAAKLDELKSEGSFVHIHEHLDVFYNGKAVTVPAYIGIDPMGSFISPLHTHQDDGILHIESPTSAQLTLGQFFTEWNVSLSGATAYDGGKQVSDPASIVLKDHQEIAVVFGTPPAQIPSVFTGVWPDGTSLAMPSPTPTASATP